MYSCVDYYPGYPYCHNTNGVEITVLRFLNLPCVTIIGVYRSPRVPLTCTQLCVAFWTNHYRIPIFLLATLMLTGVLKQRESTSL